MLNNGSAYELMEIASDSLRWLRGWFRARPRLTSLVLISFVVILTLAGYRAYLLYRELSAAAAGLVLFVQLGLHIWKLQIIMSLSDVLNQWGTITQVARTLALVYLAVFTSVLVGLYLWFKPRGTFNER